jgi:signal transduction histidine kinase
MTAGQQSKAFDSFARSRDQKAGDKAGGLGLPLARQLILAHGGDLDLTSEPGQGTLVTLRLPRQ